MFPNTRRKAEEATFCSMWSRNTSISQCIRRNIGYSSTYSSSMSRKNLGSIHSAVDGAVADSLQAEESSRTSALSFNDSKVAFESKTTFEIIRALVVYRLCSVKLLTRNAGKLLSASNAILGKTITEAAIKYTFFYHFCAGENSEDIKPVIQRLSSNGINSILDFAAERDKDPEEQTISGAECRTYNEDIADQECEENLEIFMECIRAASQFENGFAAIKLTGLGRPELLETVSDVVQSVRMAFINLQKSNPNELTWSEFLSGIRSLNVNIEDSEAKDLFHRFDQDKDGKIDFLEWTEYLRVEDSLTRPFFYQPNDSSR